MKKPLWGLEGEARSGLLGGPSRELLEQALDTRPRRSAKPWVKFLSFRSPGLRLRCSGLQKTSSGNGSAAASPWGGLVKPSSLRVSFWSATRPSRLSREDDMPGSECLLSGWLAQLFSLATVLAMGSSLNLSEPAARSLGAWGCLPGESATPLESVSGSVLVLS